MNTQLIDKTNDNLIRLANMLGYKTYRYSDGRINLMDENDLFNRDILIRASDRELSEYLISKLYSVEDILNYLLNGVSEQYLNDLFFAIRDQSWFNDPLVEKIKNLDTNSQMRIMFRINNLF
jgi:hypothetical protein